MNQHHLYWINRLKYRLWAGLITKPKQKDWIFSFICLAIYAVIFIPIGLNTGFLHWHPVSNLWIWINVAIGTLMMPGFSEELIFRVLLIPHPTEPIGPITRQRFLVLSWVLFILYHILPWTPSFFHHPPFLIGAGLLGFLCTISYLQSRCVWTPMFIHWFLVINWLLVWGGLEQLH